MTRPPGNRTVRVARAARRAGLATSLGLAAVCGAPSHALADWMIPSQCKHGLTGNEFGDPPVVEYYVNGKVQDGVVRGVTFNSKGAGKARVYEIRHSSDIYLLSVTYTPFLIGSVAIQIPFSGGRWIYERLPPAGYSANAQSKVFDTFTVTITDPDTKQIMPGASVMWEPYFTGSDPYVTTADQNGQIIINCYQNLPAGNPVYVVSADGKTEFSTAIIPNNLSASADRRRSFNSAPDVGFGGNH